MRYYRIDILNVLAPVPKIIFAVNPGNNFKEDNSGKTYHGNNESNGTIGNLEILG